MAQLEDGLSYRSLLAGLFLAGIRNIKPRPVGFKFNTVQANTLQVGSRLRINNIFGALSANATSSPTLTIKFLLGGATLASWTTPAAATTYSGIGWLNYESPVGFLVQAIGSSVLKCEAWDSALKNTVFFAPLRPPK